MAASRSARYEKLLDRFVRRTFGFWERLGLHVTRNHYYQPIPDTRSLPEEIWTKRSDLAGIDMNERGQLELLATFSARFRDEYERIPRTRTASPLEYYVDNGTFESVDGEILYCVLRHFRPRRVIEIGAGNSTLLTAKTLLRNREETGVEASFVSYEPFPKPVLQGLPGLTRLVEIEAQKIPLEEFSGLGENDVLFIDSSHVLRIGSDVQYEYLEVLPRLRKGVLVHVHDIFLPAEYRRDWVVKQHRFWTEQYLLQAFLAFNDAFEVLWAGSYMHLSHPDELEAAFRSYHRGTRSPGSFWMRKVR